jgi:hypothetical protein
MANIAQNSEPVSETIDDATADAAATRLAVRVALAGFALMFVAGALMWLKFGPTIFVDLATAVVNCF